MSESQRRLRGLPPATPVHPTVATREHPILFSDAMVRAILDGRKTVTRRPIAPQPSNARTPEDPHAWRWTWLHGIEWGTDTVAWGRVLSHCPFGAVGDHLWGREAFLPDPPRDGTWRDVEYDGVATQRLTLIPRTYRTPSHVLYRASWAGPALRWRPSIHMPRWASRLTLEVTSIGIERLWRMDEVAARAEGYRPMGNNADPLEPISALDRFRVFWDGVYAGRGLGWAVNPWVWVIRFRRTTA